MNHVCKFLFEIFVTGLEHMIEMHLINLSVLHLSEMWASYFLKV